MTSDEYGIGKGDQEVLDILGHHEQQLDRLCDRASRHDDRVDGAIRGAEELLAKLGIQEAAVVTQQPRPVQVVKTVTLLSWDEMLTEARANQARPIRFEDILTDAEMRVIEDRLGLARKEFADLYRLDATDYAICGVAGLLAALVDWFLIGMPKHPGFLGGKASEGGPLSNWIKEKINSSLTPEEIARLEKENWVPYDPSTNTNLSESVPGLSPSLHRLHSLGHDPILGFIFGVTDILRNTFTAIGSDGKLIIQVVDVTGRDTAGMGLFDAIARVFGHMKSDITSSRGLPVPLMSLFEFLQFGKFGRNEYSISEVVRIMYRQGYDFRRFISMSISPLIIEVIVRTSYLARRLMDGNDVMEALPIGNKPKLGTMLFLSHSLATLANAGKVTFHQNPLAINYPQWMAFFRYSISQLKWGLLDKPNAELQHVQKLLDGNWDLIDARLNETWVACLGDDVIVVSG